MEISRLFINQNKSIKDTMRLIDRSGLRISFVVDKDNRLVGVVTDGDIRGELLKGANLKSSIKKIMNTSPIVIEEHWDNEKIKNFLKTDKVRFQLPKFGFRRIPVLDKDRRVVDIIFAAKDGYESYKKSKVKSKVKSKDKKGIVRPANNVLVVGGAGYLGSILCRKLLDRGYNVRVLDNLMYGDQGIKDLYNHPKFELIEGDMRNIQTVVDALKGISAVVDLAAIVGDPASSLDPKETIEINYFGTRMLAEVCKYSQINRFIFASTCSVYGTSQTPGTKINEDSQLNPVSLYAEMKLKSEEGILKLASGNFSPTILRMSTLYGLSPRMRFDLVVNTLTIKALMEKQFHIFGGEQWRPNLHVSDAAEAYIKCLESPIEKISGEIFNVGSNEENYKIIEIGATIQDDLPGTKMIVDSTNIDERNYNVSFDKIEKQLKYFTQYSIINGVEEIKEAVDGGEFTDYNDPRYSNYKFLQNNDYLTEIE